MKKAAATSITFLLGSFLLTTAHAQELTGNLTPTNQQLGFYLGYYGNKLAEPGLQAGVEYYLATTPNFQVVANLYAASFWKEGLYSAFALSPRIGLRYTAGWGLTLESHFGIGYLYRYFEYHQYELNGHGDIVDKGHAGISSMMPNLALGLGYDFSRVLPLPLKLYIRPSAFVAYPAGHILFQTSYALEVGIIYVPTF